MRTNAHSSGIFPTVSESDFISATPRSERGLRFTAVPTRTRVAVAELILSLGDAVRQTAEEAGVRLYIDCGGGTLESDRAALEETLHNLVENAIGSSAVGEIVTLDTRKTDAGDQIWTLRQPRPGTPELVMRSASSTMSLGGSLAFESGEDGGTIVRIFLPQHERRGDAQTVIFRQRASTLDASA